VSTPLVDTWRPPGRRSTAPRRVVVIRPAVGGIAFVAGAGADVVRARGSDVVELVGQEGGSPALDGARKVWAHRRHIRNADVVHVEVGVTAVSTFWLALWACVLGARPVTVLHDGPVIVRAPGSGLIRTRSGRRDAVAHKLLAPLIDRPLRAWLVRRTRTWVTLTERARREVAAAGLGPVVVVPLGADPPTATVPPSACTTVVFAGFISPAKGLDVLVDAWEAVGEATGLRLVVVGDPGRQHADYASGLRSRLSGMAAPSAWEGWVTEEQAFHAAIADAAIVVLPYRASNPASGILIRAVVEGRAVLGTAVPAVEDFVDDGVSASVVPCDDVGALARALLELARDPSARDALGAAAGSWASRHCTWPAYAGHLLDAWAR